MHLNQNSNDNFQKTGNILIFFLVMRIFLPFGHTIGGIKLSGGTMKKIIAFVIVLIVCCALVACGRGNDTPATTAPATRPTTAPTTAPTTLPTTAATMPTLETNIPDPEVDTSMTTEATENDMARGRK